MSNRTLVELNHDFCPDRSTVAMTEWAAKLADYMRSGDPADLPYGVTFKHMRHHSDPDPSQAINAELLVALKQLLAFDGRAYVKGSVLAKDLLAAKKVGWAAIAKAEQSKR